MAFSWTALDDPIEVSEYTEIRSNADITADNLSVAHYNWTNVIPSVGDKITASEFIEFQDAADYLDDENYCRTEHANYNSTVDASRDIGYDLNLNTSYDNGDLAGVLVTKNGTYLNDHNSTVQSNYDSSINTNFYAAEHSSVEKSF